MDINQMPSPRSRRNSTQRVLATFDTLDERHQIIVAEKENDTPPDSQRQARGANAKGLWRGTRCAMQLKNGLNARTVEIKDETDFTAAKPDLWRKALNRTLDSKVTTHAITEHAANALADTILGDPILQASDLAGRLEPRPRGMSSPDVFNRSRSPKRFDSPVKSARREQHRTPRSTYLHARPNNEPDPSPIGRRGSAKWKTKRVRRL